MLIKINYKFKNKSINELLEFYHLSKANIYKLKINKALTVNGDFVEFDYILKENDEINIDLEYTEDIYTEESKKDIDVLYEDDDFIIIKKPRGILIHSDGNDYDTLCNRLAYYYNRNYIKSSVRVVHRIDVDTTGMVIFPKHLLSASYLSYLFENEMVEKNYQCWVKGNFVEKTGVINSAIGKDRHSNKQRISKTGKPAYTEYKVIEEKKGKTKLQVLIKGGRRHQIRVHLSSINHPILGDKIYGEESKESLKLHFYNIKFIHPRTLDLFNFSCEDIDKIK